MKNPEQNRLIKDWLCLAKENLWMQIEGLASGEASDAQKQT